MKAELVHVGMIVPDPKNPRTDFTEEKKQQLAASLRAHGVKVPLIGYVVGDRIMLGDGHCRWEAALLAGLKELPVIVFAQRPDESDLLATQLTINGHRQDLNPVDEYEAFVRLAKLKNWSPSALATGLAISNSEVTRTLAIGKLSPEERQLVREGKISKSAAYALSRMSGDERSALAHKAASGEVTRDQLNAQVRKKRTTDSVKTQRVSCALPGGTITMQSPSGVNVAGGIELLESLLGEFRKFQKQGLDISTVTKVLRDRHRQPQAV